MIKKTSVDINQKLMNFHKMIQSETLQEIANFVSKASKMEESIMAMFEKKGKVIEKITLV